MSLRSRPLWIPTLLVASIAVACNSTKKIDPGEECTLNSDCNSPLVCTMGRCHQGCRETRDCPAGQSCVMVQGAGVCQLQSEADCTSTECASGLVCAVDQRCHSGCVSETNCSQGQLCVNGVCADSLQLVDGVLPPKSGTPNGPDPGLASDIQPRITSFVAGSSSVTPDHPTTLTAIFVNGTGVITPGDIVVESGVAVPTGNLNVSTTFQLTVTGSAGQTVTATVSVTVLVPPQLVANANLITSMVTDGANLYFADEGIFKVAITGGTPVPLVTGLTGMVTLATDGVNVYWTDYSQGKVSKVSVTGTAPTTLATEQYSANSIAADGDNVYWTTEGRTPTELSMTGTVMKASIAGGTPPVTLASAQSRPNNIVVFDKNVYWTGRSPDLGGTISAVAAAGGAPPRAMAVALQITGNIAVDARGIHWIEGDNLVRLPLGGTAHKVLQPAVSVGMGCSLAIDTDFAYWANVISPIRIKKVALEGTAPIVTLTSMDATAYTPILIIDATNIYFTVLPGGIYRLPK